MTEYSFEDHNDLSDTAFRNVQKVQGKEIHVKPVRKLTVHWTGEQLSINLHIEALSVTSTTTSQRWLLGSEWQVTVQNEKKKRVTRHRGLGLYLLQLKDAPRKSFKNQTPQRQCLKVFSLKLKSRDINWKWMCCSVWRQVHLFCDV